MYKKYVKRFFDILLCSFALIVLSPIFVLTAAAIKMSSAGPVFYYSYRNGINGVPFKFYKFRSMHVANGNDKGLCIADSDRVFTVGRIIRKLKIDELPQLLNVIKGDMSIVGPRPMASDSVDNFYSGKYQAITSIKPGLTSAASLYDYIVGDTYFDEEKYREEVIPIKLELEMYYLQHESLRYDTELIFRTMLIILQMLCGKRKFQELWEINRICLKTKV